MNRLKRLARIDAIGLAVVGVLTAGAAAVGFGPVLAQRAEAASKAESLTRERDEADRLAVRLRSLRGDLAATERARQSGAMRLQSVGALNQRVGAIMELATRCGLDIDQIEPGSPIAGEHFVRVPIRLGGNGGYSAASVFLNELHDKLPDITVSSLNLAGRQVVAGEIPTYRFSLEWYAAPGP